MTKKVLLTSFSIWQTNQASNSSDELISDFFHRYSQPNFYQLRQLPVNVPVAVEMTIAKIQVIQPQLIVACGMAMGRSKLGVESQAVVGKHRLFTSLDLAKLTQDLSITEISDDAGRFVCNGLYYKLLNYLQQHHPKAECVFLHVPILTSENRSQIMDDFKVILERASYANKIQVRTN